MGRAPPTPSTTKIIVWFSRHLPTHSQLSELNLLYPNHLLRIDTRAFDGADDVVERFHALSGDEMVVVAPLTVIRELVKRGIRPLRAVMEQCAEVDAEVSVNGRHYRFLHFNRITDITVEEEELAHNAT